MGRNPHANFIDAILICIGDFQLNNFYCTGKNETKSEEDPSSAG